MSKGKRKTSLADLSRQKPTHEEFMAISANYASGEDRSVAILAALEVEASLEDALCHEMAKLSTRDTNVEWNDKHFKNLFGDDRACLADFRSKIYLAYGLNIIGSKLVKSINSIRHIRNTFAHSLKPISFKTELIRAEVESIPIDITKLFNFDSITQSDKNTYFENFGKYKYILSCQICSTTIQIRNVTTSADDFPWLQP